MDINSLLQDMGKLPDLAKLLQSLTESMLGAILLAIYFLIVVFNKVPQMALVQSWNKKREDRTKALEAYADTKDADDVIKAVITDQRDTRYFQRLTGIHAEAQWRDGLADLRKRSKATWLEMKRAWRYMDFDSDNTLQIRDFTSFEKFERVYNTAMAVLFGIGTALVFIFAISSARDTVANTQTVSKTASSQSAGASSASQPHSTTALSQAAGNVAMGQATSAASSTRASGTAAPAGKAVTVTSVQTRLTDTLLAMLFAFGLLGATFWAASQNLPMTAAKKIKREANGSKTSAASANNPANESTVINMNAGQDSKLVELINQEVHELRIVASLRLPSVFIGWFRDMWRTVRPVFLAPLAQAASVNERLYLRKLIKPGKTVRGVDLWKLRKKLRVVEQRNQDRAARRILIAEGFGKTVKTQRVPQLGGTYLMHTIKPKTINFEFVNTAHYRVDGMDKFVPSYSDLATPWTISAGTFVYKKP